MAKHIEVHLENKTVRQALDSILHNGRGFSWRLRNGIIEITNTRASKRAQSQLNTVIPVFRIADGETTRMASVMLWLRRLEERTGDGNRFRVAGRRNSRDDLAVATVLSASMAVENLETSEPIFECIDLGGRGGWEKVS